MIRESDPIHSYVDALKKISDASILVVGDIMLDRYWWGTVDRISPEAPVPIVRLQEMSLSPGGAANVASNLIALGSRAHLLGVTGDDAEADQLRGVIDGQGMMNCTILPVTDRRTTVKTRIVAHHQHVVRIDQESTDYVSSEWAEKLVEAADRVIAEVDGIILSDYAKGVFSADVLDHLISAARRLGKPIVIDPKGSDFTRYNGASYVTPNRREAAVAADVAIDVTDMTMRAGEKLLADLDIGGLLVTEGEHGMTLFDGAGGSYHLDSLAQDVYDVTGAGDTVIAAFTACLVTGTTPLNAAKVANAAAGIAVSRVGTSTVTQESVLDFLKHNSDRLV